MGDHTTYADSLRAEVRSTELACQGWHLHVNEATGWIWAEKDARPAAGGPPVTLRARTPQLMRQDIARWEHQHKAVTA